MTEADDRVTTVVGQEFDPGSKIYIRTSAVKRWPKPAKKNYQLNLNLDNANGQLSFDGHLPGDVARDLVNSEG